MKYSRIDHQSSAILLVSPGIQAIGSETQLLDVVSACSEFICDRILFEKGSFTSDFFQLSTRLAGEILLKLSMYRVPAALICPTEELPTGKFYEFVLETNRGNAFRIFTDRAAAENWLASLKTSRF